MLSLDILPQLPLLDSLSQTCSKATPLVDYRYSQIDNQYNSSQSPNYQMSPGQVKSQRLKTLHMFLRGRDSNYELSQELDLGES